MTIFDPAKLSKAQRKSIQRKHFSELPEEDSTRFDKWQAECDVIFNDVILPEDADKSLVGFEMSHDDKILIPNTEITRRDFCALVNHHVPNLEQTTDVDSIVNEYIRMICQHVNLETILAAREEKAIKDRELAIKAKEDERVALEAKATKGRELTKQAKDNVDLELSFIDIDVPPAQVPAQAPAQVPRQGNKASRRRSRSPDIESSSSTRDRRPDDVEKTQSSTASTDRLSCKMIKLEAFQTITNSEYGADANGELVADADVKIQGMLDDIGCSPENFKSLDYLFIPIHYDSYHMVLIGIAPKQKYAFVIDSQMTELSTAPFPMGTGEKHEDRWYRRGLQALLMLLDPVAKFTVDNVPVPMVDKKRQWYIFGQYVLRSKRTDKSPRAVQQKDLYNCGAYAMMNAFCLAFGYDLKCYEERDLDEWKKPRIAFELMRRAFTGAYKYDMIKISEKDVTLEDEESEAKVSDDSGIQYGIKQSQQDITAVSDDVEYDSDNISEGSDGEVDEAAESMKGRAFYTAIQARLRQTRRVQADPAKLPWPPQFNSSILFQRAQLLYPAPPVNFLPFLKYSKRELKQACREFPLTGWKPWSKQSQPLFLEWMLNEMAATLALINNDPIKPSNIMATTDESPEEGDKRKRGQHEIDYERGGNTKRR